MASPKDHAWQNTTTPENEKAENRLCPSLKAWPLRQALQENGNN
jgi:hypothetical protein